MRNIKYCSWPTGVTNSADGPSLRLNIAMMSMIHYKSTLKAKKAALFVLEYTCVCNEKVFYWAKNSLLPDFPQVSIKFLDFS